MIDTSSPPDLKSRFNRDDCENKPADFRRIPDDGATRTEIAEMETVL